MPAAKTSAKTVFFLAAACFCAARITYGQSVDTIVEIPTTGHGSALVEIPTIRQETDDSNSEAKITMAREYKSTKEVVEQEKPIFWRWYAEAGYESEYNFRGTNLTPGADGAGTFDVEVSKSNFTLGFYGIHQFGKASSPSWSIGEGGGGWVATTQMVPNVGPIPYTRFPTTVQTRFNELDIFLSYKF
ncbi:MAG TPA: hypothetical protein VGG94_00650, partial [Chthoniobacterales bacterium]